LWRVMHIICVSSEYQEHWCWGVPASVIILERNMCSDMQL
jgi:hypothetical protein